MPMGDDSFLNATSRLHSSRALQTVLLTLPPLLMKIILSGHREKGTEDNPSQPKRDQGQSQVHAWLSGWGARESLQGQA